MTRSRALILRQQRALYLASWAADIAVSLVFVALIYVALGVWP